jgi:hypothetical protein
MIDVDTDGIECGCLYMPGYDDNPPEVIIEYFPTAIKEHTCFECGRTIKKGEVYHKCKGKWEGEWSTYKTCIGCHRLRDLFCEGWCFGGLADSIWYEFGTDITADNLYASEADKWKPPIS